MEITYVHELGQAQFQRLPRLTNPCILMILKLYINSKLIISKILTGRTKIESSFNSLHPFSGYTYCLQDDLFLNPKNDSITYSFSRVLKNKSISFSVAPSFSNVYPREEPTESWKMSY